MKKDLYSAETLFRFELIEIMRASGMKTDGATGPLGRIIIYIYSSRSKNIFIKCKCMTTISSFVGRILTTENLWCSQFPSFRFFLYSYNALHFPGLIQ